MREPEPSAPYVPTPIAHSTGFMDSASLGGMEFKAPTDLPDVRPRGNGPTQQT